ncbi:MAG: hypothetical protein JOZ83_06025 [Silvibacterium sp.]|nr:hypothetical protein [Silvibacterium sp.]
MPGRSHEAQTVNREILAGTAEMRRRQVQQALGLQARALKRLYAMSDAEVAQLSPYELCLMMKTGADLEKGARAIDPEEIGFQPGLAPPVFNIQVIRVPPDMIGVQLEDGRYGYIDPKCVDDFRRDHPTALVII